MHIDKAHWEICEAACSIANKKLTTQYSNIGRRVQGSSVFRPSPNLEGAGPLSLTFEGFIHYFEPGQRQYVRETMKKIGAESIREAIAQKSDLFAGLIVADAKRGRNYFDQFSNDNGPQVI